MSASKMSSSTKDVSKSNIKRLKTILKFSFVSYSIIKEFNKEDTSVGKIASVAIQASVASDFIASSIEDELNGDGVSSVISQTIKTVEQIIPIVTECYQHCMKDDEPITNNEKGESVDV